MIISIWRGKYPNLGEGTVNYKGGELRVHYIPSIYRKVHSTLHCFAILVVTIVA